MKHIKTLGVLVVAAMAVTAFVGVSSASAFTMFNASAAGAAISETTLQTHVFTVTGSEVKCTNITYTGTTGGTTTTAQMVTPKYEGCTAFGLPATVTNKNCTYNLTIGTPSGNTVHMERINAAEPCEITILAKNIFGECHVDVTEQTVNGITYTNDGGSNIIVDIEASGISDHVTKSTGVCPLTVGTHTNATYTGQSTVSASGASISVS